MFALAREVHLVLGYRYKRRRLSEPRGSYRAARGVCPFELDNCTLGKNDCSRLRACAAPVSVLNEVVRIRLGLRESVLAASSLCCFNFVPQ